MSEMSSNRPRVPLLAVYSFAALAAFAGAGATRAYAADSEDDPEVVAQAKEHYKAGLDAYKAGKFDVAIRELKKAYLLKRLAPLLLNIGATYRKMGDLDLSLHFYQKFLDEAPSDAKDRPEVEKIIGEIKAQKSAAPIDENAGKAPEDLPPPKRGSDKGEWNHNIIDAAPPETPIDVSVSTPVMKGVKVFVFYRSAGQADFNSVLMKRRGRQKVGRIPGEAVTGRSLQYYIEAKDSAGTVVKSAGNSGNPNIIMVEEGVKPVMIASSSRRQSEDEGEEQAGEDEDKPKKKKKPQRNLDDEDAPTTGQVDLSDDEPKPRKKRASSGGLRPLQMGGIIGLSLGVGFAAAGGAMLGLAKNTADTISADSRNPLDANNMPIYFNNDPAVDNDANQEVALHNRGKLFDGLGIGFTTIGGLGIVAGASCLIADAVMQAEKSAPKKKHRKKKRRVVEDDEEEETRNWYLAPVTGPTVVGVSGGFSF